MLSKTNVLFTLVILVLIALLSLQMCSTRSLRSKVKEKENLITALADTMKTYRNDNGYMVSTISVLQTQRTKDFLQLATKDKEIIDLQIVVNDYKKKLKAGSSVTNTSTETVVDNVNPTVIVKQDTIRKDSLIYVYPIYQDTIKNEWIDYTATMNRDTATVKLKVTDKYSTIVGWDKKKPFVDVISYSPYTSVKQTRTYQVSIPKQNKIRLFIIGGVVGAVITTAIFILIPK